jgi:hypothetical protein
MIGISLGWRCDSATYGVKHNLRIRNDNGYKTCPFDLMVSNYIGLIACIKDDFKYFCDPEYLVLKPMSPDTQWKDEVFIYNTKYKFIFNHESPGHANLYIMQRWSGGINHFCDNNFAELIKRYSNRIRNFRNYINSKDKIIFILDRFGTNDNNQKLTDTIKAKYPTLDFEIVTINNCNEKFYLDHMKILMGFEDNEITNFVKL